MHKRMAPVRTVLSVVRMAVTKPVSDGRTIGQRAADAVAGFAGSWLFVGVHVVWFALWLALRLDINLLTLVVSLEAIFLATFVLMSQNRAGDVAQAQQDRIETLERHMAKLAEVDHAEHGRMLRQLVEHTVCTGHTVIESAPTAAGMVGTVGGGAALGGGLAPVKRSHRAKAQAKEPTA